MTGPEFRAALTDLGLTQREFARQAGILPSSVTRYVNGDRPVPGWVEWIFRLLGQKAP